MNGKDGAAKQMSAETAIGQLSDAAVKRTAIEAMAAMSITVAPIQMPTEPAAVQPSTPVRPNTQHRPSTT